MDKHAHNKPTSIAAHTYTQTTTQLVLFPDQALLSLKEKKTGTYIVTGE